LFTATNSKKISISWSKEVKILKKIKLVIIALVNEQPLDPKQKDHPLIWLSVVKEEKASLSTFKVATLFCYFQGICRGRSCVATFDRSDIRGLDTARPVFIAELPLSNGGHSENLIP